MISWMRALLLGLGLTLAPSAPADAPETPGYHVDQGRLLDPQGRVIALRGLNLHGFNSEILIPTYLWRMGWREQIAQIKRLGFNAVRLPFVPETLYSKRRVGVDLKTTVEPHKNAALLGKTPLQVLDLWMAEAERQGLYVLLDFHSVSRRGQYPRWTVDDPEHYRRGGWGETWNAAAYREEDWVRDLVFVARRYADHAHFLGIDLYNEPHDVGWGEWKLAAERAAAAILAANPRLLVFVQGIDIDAGGEPSDVPLNWGENLQPQAARPLAIRADKLVLAPHTYGPDVLQATPKASFAAPQFPANLAADWERLFGQFHPRHAVVLGEFGGHYGRGPSGQRDRIWHEALVNYLIAKGMRSSFYWCYTPNSEGTGGILDERLRPRADKLALLQRLWGQSAEKSAGRSPPSGLP